MSYWSSISSMTVIYQIVSKTQDKITEPWNIGHCDLHLFWGQRLHHTDSLSKGLTAVHQIVFKILSKNTQPWNIGHTDLHLMTQKPRSYGCLISDIILLEGISIKERSNITLFKLSRSFIRRMNEVIPQKEACILHLPVYIWAYSEDS